jgi:hypothetical protein
MEVPEKYHFLKADYIVRLCKQATASAKKALVLEFEKVDNIDNDEARNENISNQKIGEDVGEPKDTSTTVKKKAPAKKRKSIAVTKESDVDEDEMFENSEIEYSEKAEQESDD